MCGMVVSISEDAMGYYFIVDSIGWCISVKVTDRKPVLPEEGLAQWTNQRGL